MAAEASPFELVRAACAVWLGDDAQFRDNGDVKKHEERQTMKCTQIASISVKQAHDPRAHQVIVKLEHW
jgi:hypothetical protein